MSINIKTIIGLGNPGKQYEKTRHNIGFRIVDALAEKHVVHFISNAYMEYSEIILQTIENTHRIILVKPLTYMNESGKVLPFLLKKGIKASEILVIHDELEKPFGKLHCRKGGSARGHNGLKSLISVIGEDFFRLRFGIGRPEKKEDVSHYVLSNFNKEEETELPALIEESLQMIEKNILIS